MYFTTTIILVISILQTKEINNDYDDKLSEAISIDIAEDLDKILIILEKTI